MTSAKDLLGYVYTAVDNSNLIPRVSPLHAPGSEGITLVLTPKRYWTGLSFTHKMPTSENQIETEVNKLKRSEDWAMGAILPLTG